LVGAVDTAVDAVWDLRRKAAWDLGRDAEPFASREEALEAETRTIRKEFPKSNNVYNGRRHPAQELRLVAKAEECSLTKT
jgi:hypothetical protein